MALDPELELGVVDLGMSDYSLLNRNDEFPAEKLQDTSCFEPMPPSEVSGYLSRARICWLSTVMEAQMLTSRCG